MFTMRPWTRFNRALKVISKNVKINSKRLIREEMPELKWCDFVCFHQLGSEVLHSEQSVHVRGV